MNVDMGQWEDRGVAQAEEASDATQKSRRRLILIAGILLVVIAGIGLIVSRHKGSDTSSVQALPTVSYIVPGKTSVAATITATGTLSARREMPVGVAGEGGMISRVLVDAGDWVKAGQTLATVDPAVQAAQVGQMQAQIASAEANAKLAQSQLDRAQALVARGFISKSDIDTRTANRDAANAAVGLARAQYREQTARLGRLDIRAPAAGLILARNVEAGQIVSSGSNALFEIARDGELEMHAKLAEQDLAGVRIGLPVQVTPVGSQQAYTGQVWQVSPIIDPQTRQGDARVALHYAEGLRPGGFASASFTTERSQAPMLPESAVQSDATGNYVYIIDRDDKIARRDVKVGDATDTGVAILSGLDGSERVVYSAGAFVNPGEKVMPDRKGNG